MSDNIIIHGDITVEGFESLYVQAIKIEQKLNFHSRLTLQGIVMEKRDDCLDSLTVNAKIQLKMKGEALYVGSIIEAAVTNINDVYHVKVTALSNTYKMDVEKKSKSFQDKDMTYKALINEIVGRGSYGRFMDKVTEDALIKKPIIQYKETDWAFLVRMASHFNTSLVTNCTDAGAQFYFGLPSIDKGEISNYNYRVKKDLERYKRLSPECPDIFEIDCIYYEVETDAIYDLGDSVTFKSRPMYIIETIYQYDNGVIKNICMLSSKNGAKTAHQPNNNISGCSLFGEVIAVARDNVKIHLEIDKSQSVDKAYWYPYASMYASEAETGWYCMPELGDTIRLYHPENDEGRAMAINAIKPHDPNEDVEKLDSGHRMSNTDIKYLRTAFGKEIKFRPDGIDIIAKDGTVFMTLNDDGTVNLNSNDVISFTAVNDIKIKARNVNVEATHHIRMKAKGSSIDMEEDIVLEGTEVKTN